MIENLHIDVTHASPVLWITRKLSANTEARAVRDYDTILEPDDVPASRDRIIEMSAKVDAIVPCHSEVFDREVVSQLGDRLKIIANYSVGVDHCDLSALAERGIVVTNTPDVLSDATAEIAILLMLGAARRAVEGDAAVRSRQWNSWSPSFMVGHQVTGKTMGIVGMGRVGQVVARRAAGFDMQVHYHNRNRLAPELERGAVFHESLESLLEVSQVLSLHCPATPQTRKLMNDSTFSVLPDNAIFVNCARGALVDEDALINAIESRKLAAAGLDCFETEPGGNEKFSSYQNIFMLPHIGSATLETRDAMGYRALDNLDAFFRGDEPRDRLV
ncbi:MAG: D-glycerate dehydrogenase [Acidiferrobacterales bacterium]|nr:D-glycerate dehydrogenase [Acidiferrobacterales bacterium]